MNVTFADCPPIGTGLPGGDDHDESGVVVESPEDVLGLGEPGFRSIMQRTARRRARALDEDARRKLRVLGRGNDHLRTLPTFDCFAKLDGHDVTVWNDHTEDVDVLAERLHDADVLVLIRERTRITRELFERLPLCANCHARSTP